MEGRIAKLESDMDYVKRDLAGLRDDARSIGQTVGRVEIGLKAVEEQQKAAPTGREFGDVKVALGNLATTVATLPSKTWSFVVLLAMMTFLAALVGLIVRFVPATH